MIAQEDGTMSQELQIFSTMTTDLLALADRLRQRQIDVVALESIGIYWLPKKNTDRPFLRI